MRQTARFKPSSTRLMAEQHTLGGRIPALGRLQPARPPSVPSLCRGRIDAIASKPCPRSTQSAGHPGHTGWVQRQGGVQPPVKPTHPGCGRGGGGGFSYPANSASIRMFCTYISYHFTRINTKREKPIRPGRSRRGGSGGGWGWRRRRRAASTTSCVTPSAASSHPPPRPAGVGRPHRTPAAGGRRRGPSRSGLAGAK